MFITLGAALIGWVAGDAISHDVALISVFENNLYLSYGLKAGCAVFVVVIGKWLAAQAGKKRHAAKAG